MLGDDILTGVQTFLVLINRYTPNFDIGCDSLYYTQPLSDN